jgi:hypothetical protein
LLDCGRGAFADDGVRLLLQRRDFIAQLLKNDL